MADWGDASVRVTGVRRRRFVEFELSLGRELVVELVMPYHEFRTFCDEHHARVLPSEGEAALAFMALSDQESN